ncbi:MAG: site-specific integrase [Clostridium sp.]|nr:site-specific integrase [Clostridium sp.]
MRSIKQIQSINGTYFNLYLDDTIIKEVKITRVKRERDGTIYIILLDSNGKVIDEVYKYINFYCNSYSINRREQIISALKLLYSFIELYDKSLYSLERRDIKNLSSFILGLTIDDESGNQIMGRGISTHNLYLDNIREFFKYLRIENEYLFEKRVVSSIRSGYGFLSHTKTVQTEKYSTNLKGNSIKDKVVPKYISLDEYRKIVKFIEENSGRNTLRNRIIVELMYTTGMRLGEVLGLTLEDVKDNKDNPDFGVLYIRNRLTDKKYQNAKGCMKVKHLKDYFSKQYQKKDYGYQIINIGPELYKLLKAYIDESRSVLELSEKVYNNMAFYALADSVCNYKENQYIFLNKNGYPLSSSGWNKFIKNVFKSLNIDLDEKNKQNNLSHRFRHGFAMYLIQIEGKSVEYVKNRMRHVSIQSTLVYYNPTEDEKLRAIEDLEKKLRNDINRENENE